MTFEEADELVDNFVGKFRIQDSIETYLNVYQISELPCPSGRLRLAHFLLAEHFIKDGRLTKNMGDLLIKSYAYIARFIDENKNEIDEINKQNEVYWKNLKKRKFQAAPVLAGINLRMLENTIEFNNFLSDCQSKYPKK